MNKVIMLSVLLLGLTGCPPAAYKPAEVEPGYHHLMRSVKARHMQTCENLEHDGSTCYRFDDNEVCGSTRDAAAEATAVFIDKHYAIPQTFSCNGCK